MKIEYPFLFVNPKSYLYGDQCLKLALAVDEIAAETDLQIFFTCPYTDIRMIAEMTKHVVVTAQSMDSLVPGRGMGKILVESLKAAGAKAVVLNHAENTKTLSEIGKCIARARENDMAVIVCADSVDEAIAVSSMKPDIVLAEPTDLIGTGQTADDEYVVSVLEKLRKAARDVSIMIASGITTADDCYRMISLGADGVGSTSGVVKAPDPALRVREMAKATLEAKKR